jgi:hypothetical protein
MAPNILVKNEARIDINFSFTSMSGIDRFRATRVKADKGGAAAGCAAS